MLVQRAGSGIVPPPTVTPDWETLATVWDKEVLATKGAPEVVRIGPSEVTLGHDDFEAEDASAPDGWKSHYEFGWDNEHPRRTTSIGAVDVSTRPITNGDYLAYLASIGKAENIPASWVRIDGETRVRTLYGPVQFEAAKHWPLAASYDEIAAYAHAQGGRLPSEAELLAFRDAYDGSSGAIGNIGYRNWHYVP
jgi:formylglycine-generating enzyme required for sulfatase activity